MRPPGDDHSPTALVLGGGGRLGAAQVGALQALYSTGFRPDLIVGTSVGAINGAFLAFHPGTEGPARLARIWESLGRSGIFEPNPLRVAWGLVRDRVGLYCNDRLRELLRSHLGAAEFAGTAIPLAVVATNLTRGRTEAFRSGSVVEAVLASSAIPGIFCPVEIAGERYVDGGVLGEAYVDAAVAMDAHRIVTVEMRTPAKRPATMLGVLERSLSLMVARATDERARHLDSAVRLQRLLLNVDAPGGFRDFRHTRALIERARSATGAALQRDSATGAASRRLVIPVDCCD